MSKILARSMDRDFKNWNLKKNALKSLSSEYLQKAASSITTFEAYLVEDDLHGDEMVLRKIIETNRSGGVSTNPSETKTCWPETLTKISLLSGFFARPT